MGCIKSSGTIKITTNSETRKSNEIEPKKVLTIISSSSCESDSDISSNISSINNSPILKNNSFIFEKK